MTSIHNIYEPYDFSANPCYVIEYQIVTSGYQKIEHKLPGYIQKLKGVFVSVDCRMSAGKQIGIIILNFNGQGLKNIQLPIIRSNIARDHSRPVPLDEEIQPNSFLQGFYYDMMNIPMNYPYTLKIYLHYQKK